jgi:Skp family chaperone for outer membrane proteins
MRGPKDRQEGSTKMEKYHLNVLVPGLFAAAALALAVGVAAQTPPASGPQPAEENLQATPMTGHHKHSAARAKHHADMKLECQAMMAKKQEMQDKLQAMDAALDKLVAEMNAAQESKEAGAMEKSMAAVINELVAERKASRSMMMEMQPVMMTHMMQHMHMHGTRGAMECPMMKHGNPPEHEAEEMKHKM